MCRKNRATRVRTGGSFKQPPLDLCYESTNFSRWSSPKDKTMPPISEVWVALRILELRKDLVDGHARKIRGQQLYSLLRISDRAMGVVP